MVAEHQNLPQKKLMSSASSSRSRTLLRSTKLCSLATPSAWTFAAQTVSFASGESNKLPSISQPSAAWTSSLAMSWSNLQLLRRSSSFMRQQASIGVEQAASTIFQLSGSMIFSSTPVSTRNLQSNLVWTTLWLSLSRRSLPRMNQSQLRHLHRLPQLQQPSSGWQLPRTCTNLWVTPFVLQSSFLPSKLQRPQLGRELSQKEPQQQLQTRNLQAGSMGACPACSVEKGTFHFTWSFSLHRNLAASSHSLPAQLGRNSLPTAQRQQLQPWWTKLYSSSLSLAMRQAALQGTLSSLEFEPNFACAALLVQKAAFTRAQEELLSSLASTQLSGDSFMISFSRGGVQLVHLVFDLVDAWLKEKELAALLLSTIEIENFDRDWIFSIIGPSGLSCGNFASKHLDASPCPLESVAIHMSKVHSGNGRYRGETCLMRNH